MKRNRIVIIAALVLIVILAGCSRDKGFVTNGKKVVKVNGEYITDDLLNMFAQNGYLTEEQKKVIVEELIDNYLVYDEALKSNVMKDTLFLNQLELQRRLTIANKFIDDKLNAIPMPQEADLKNYYDYYKSNFDKQIKIAAIFVHPAKGKAVADSLYDLIKRKKITFESAAKDHSIHEMTADNGGKFDNYFNYLDWTMTGYPLIDSVAFSLQKKGDISEPFLTVQGGYAILKLLDAIPSNKKYEDVRNLILTIVYQDKKTSNLDAYLTKIRQEAKIDYYDQN